MNTRYRVEPMGNVKRTAGKALPLAVLGLGAYALWQKRDQLTELFQGLKDKLGTAGGGVDGGGSPAVEAVPADYDYNRPSVFNSTAMAGPRDGRIESAGVEGGSMGTSPGTQGEGAQ